MPDFPFISRDLIEELDRIFPERSADLKWTDREVWFYSGQRNVVRILRSHHEAQLERTMEGLTRDVRLQETQDT